MTTNRSLNKLLEKVKDAISSQPIIESEKSKTNCSHHFGYLAELPKNSHFPEECLLCLRIVECIILL
jgi:hypothetical protein